MAKNEQNVIYIRGAKPSASIFIPTATKKVGRPPLWSKEIEDKVVAGVACGFSLDYISDALGCPRRSTVRLHAKENPIFAVRLSQARNYRAAQKIVKMGEKLGFVKRTDKYTPPGELHKCPGWEKLLTAQIRWCYRKYGAGIDPKFRRNITTKEVATYFEANENKQSFLCLAIFFFLEGGETKESGTALSWLVRKVADLLPACHANIERQARRRSPKRAIRKPIEHLDPTDFGWPPHPRGR